MNKNRITKNIWASLLIVVFNYNKAFADWPDQGTMVDGYQMMGTGMDWMMMLFWGMVLGVLILVTRWVSRLPQGENQFSVIQKSAMEILEERFVKGEINSAEFELKKQAISE